MNETNDELARIALEKEAVRKAILKSLDNQCYRGRPIERLAAQIAVTLIGRARHTPETLQRLLDCADELRGRLNSAKV